MKSILFSIKRDWTLFVTLSLFSVTVLFINPMRELGIFDDWAYAFTTKHLLDTGTYKLHDWLTANIHFQAYWGSLFALIGGYSFSTLRISTLVLSLLGLIAFYHLAREYDLNRVQAGILTLALFSNYLYLLLSFTFMSNIPFESTLIISLYLYTKAIRLHSYVLMLLASLAASAAIMTRQFGFALVLAGFCILIFSSERRQIIKLFFVGFFLPILAIIWQVLYSILTPNWAVFLVRYQQKLYFDDINSVLLNIIYRPSIIIQYMALFILPLILFLLIDFVREIKNKKILLTQLNKSSLILTIISLYIFTSMLFSCFIYKSCSIQALINNKFPKIPIFITVFTVLGAILLIRIILLKYMNYQIKKISLKYKFLDIVTLFLLFFNLIFYQIFDMYLLVFLPYILIVTGQYLGDFLNKYSRAITVTLICILMFSSLTIRGFLELKEAEWKGGDFLVSQGIPNNQIYSTQSWEWNLAYKFQDYLQQKDRQYSLDNVFQWMEIQSKKAKFLVTKSLDNLPDKNFSIIQEIPYRDTLLRKKNKVYVIQRKILN